MWASQAFSIFGSQVVGFALAWYLARETGSATILSTAIMAAMIPSIVLGPFIGPFIDRWSRKKIMIYSDLSTALLTLVLVILFYTNTIQVWHIYVVLAGRSIGGAFQGPAMMASFTSIVPEKHLTRAYGLNAMLGGLLGIVAPPVGAFLMEALSMQWVLSVDIFTAIIAIGILLTLTIPQPLRTTLTAKMNLIGDMMQSFRYLWKRRGLANLVGLAALLNFFCAPLFLFAMLVTEKLGGDVLKLGWLNSAVGVGTILGGALIGVWGGFKKRIYTSLLGVMILGLAMFAIGFASERLFYFIIAAVLILGMSNPVANSPVPAIMNAIVAKDMQGRIFSMVGSLGNLMMPLGLAIAGPVADAVGIQWVYFIGGVGIIAILPFALLNKPIMNIEKLPPEENPVAES
jgi:DHA3 family macrolide efflux protein-like MFS transporter